MTQKISEKNRFYDKNKLLLESIILIFIILMFTAALIVHPMLADRIPTHWNASGIPDGFSGKDSIYFLPALYVFISIILFILPMMEVFRKNMLDIYRQYYAFKIMFAFFFTGLFAVTLLAALGNQINVSFAILLMVGMLFVGLGTLLPKLKRNFVFGIRTGWTISSDKVWEKTHKLAGKMFIISGLLTIAFTLMFKLNIAFILFIAMIIATSLSLVWYSYIKYRDSKG